MLSNSKQGFFVIRSIHSMVLFGVRSVDHPGHAGHYVSWMGVLLVGVQVNPLGESLQANKTEVRLFTTMDQLMSLEFTRRREPLVAKFTGVFFLELFLQQLQLLLEENGQLVGGNTSLFSFLMLSLYFYPLHFLLLNCTEAMTWTLC